MYSNNLSNGYANGHSNANGTDWKETFQKKAAGYVKEDKYDADLTQKIAEQYRGILSKLGEDPSREGLLKTPERVAKALQFLTSGYQQDAAAILRGAMFAEDYGNMVVVKDIEFYSMCEHHILPFWGKMHVAYIPNGHIVGLSKIPRVVDVFSRRLQVQERLTNEVLECIDATLKPRGVAVIAEASHMCMMMRGVQKQNSTTVTSSFTGECKDINVRNEFFRMIGSKFS